MKTLTPKQEARLQKKKKKIAALAEVMKLNDRDGRTKKSRTNSESSTSSSTSEVQESTNKDKSIDFPPDCKDTVESTRKRSKDESIGEDERGSKKVKLSDEVNKKDHDISMTPVELSESQYAQLKRELNNRKRAIKQGPRLRFKEQGLQASLDIKDEERTPIFLTDIQHLLMVALFGSESPCSPWRWCHLEKGKRLPHTVVLVIEGLSLYHFVSYGSKFAEANRLFEYKLDVVMPRFKEGRIIEQLASVPLTRSEKEKLIQQYGSLEAALEANKESSLLIKTLFPVESLDDTPAKKVPIPSCDKFPRTQLLLSALQMIDEGYPLPLRGKLARLVAKYKLTKDVYAEVTPNSPMFGVDCEMCRTHLGGIELTRISIVDEDLKPIYETLVKPVNKIFDYLTQYSGITPEMMLNVTKKLEEVQAEVSALLPPDAILVGQSLNSDLHAMRMMHPYVIDTSVIFNMTGQRKIKSKLSLLAEKFLGEIIQQGGDGHDPLEDSTASMKLVKLKLSKGLEYGDAILTGRKKSNEVYGSSMPESKAQGEQTDTIADQSKDTVSHNLFGHIAKCQRTSAVVTGSEVEFDLQNVFNRDGTETSDVSENTKSAPSIDCFRTDGNKAAVRKTRETIPNYAMTITNLNVTSQYLEESRIEKTISNVDKWISRVHDSVATDGLFIVLLGGTQSASSGVAMVKIKKDGTDIAADTPITL